MLSDSDKKFIEEHRNEDVQKLLLSKHKYPGQDIEFLTDQIDGHRRAHLKFPGLSQYDTIVYPPKISFEQASSEQTAIYKQQFVKGLTIADLTGGFGIDSLYLSAFAKHLTYIEQKEHLVNIARHNFKVLNRANVTLINADSLSYLSETTEHYDLIYIDPARRGLNNNKLFSFADCEPDILQSKALLFSKAPLLLIKASPMLDISMAVKQLGCVLQVHVLSVKNECKELLFLCSEVDYKDEADILIKAVELESAQDRIQPFVFKMTEENSAQAVYADEIKNYLYDPFASLLKSGCFNLLSERFNLAKLHKHAHLYTSDDLRAEFPGRIFKVHKTFSAKEIKLHLPSLKANVARRHFPMTTDEIRRKYKLSEGGQSFLFFTSMANDKKIVVLAERIA